MLHATFIVKMHLPDGLIDPRLAGSLGLAALAMTVLALNKVKEAVTRPVAQAALAGIGTNISTIKNKARQALSAFGQQSLIKAGLVTALVFVIQLFDFPVPGGTTGHLLGGALAAILLGPWAGFLCLTAVVTIQALLGDGGLTALGANIINLAFIGSFVAYYLYRGLVTRLNDLLAIGLSAWLAVCLASLAYSLEVRQGVVAMLSTHAIIGLAEALFTIGLVSLIRTLIDPLLTKPRSM
jgi:cobalt/nickel transport system permease protein